jgi:hypothetical protein
MNMPSAERAELILAHLARYPHLDATAFEIARALGWSRAGEKRAREVLETLGTAGRVVRTEHKTPRRITWRAREETCRTGAHADGRVVGAHR